MSGSFQTGASSIDLNGSPWNVTDVLEVYVLWNGTSFALYEEDSCENALSPAVLVVPGSKSTGLYFYISTESVDYADTKFCDGSGSLPLPVTWKPSPGTPCPSTVTYGKVKSDRSAFSMKDYYTPSRLEEHQFDINIELKDGTIQGAFDAVREVDPTIVEVGEEPPSGGGVKK